MTEEKQSFDLSQCPHPMSEEFILMDDDLFYACDKYQEYTQRATAAPKGQKVNSDIPCDHITQEGNYCRGTVELKRLDLPKEIHWECQKCGSRGAIINFENSYWDLSPLPAQEKEQFLNQNYDELFNYEDGFEEFDEELWPDAPLPAELESLMQEMDDEEMQALSSLPFDQLYPQLFKKVIGISEDTLMQLFSSDWKEPGAPLYIRDDISFEDHRQSLFFYNARSFLQFLTEKESVETTQTGNLKRKTVKALIEACRWPGGYLDKIYSVNKVINEQDIWLLHKIRVLLELSGLIQKKKGAFWPIKKRLHLIEKEQAGKLFQRLFHTYFVKMNMAYRGSNFAANIQDGLPYSFYRLHQHEAEWASPEQLYKRMILPVDRMEMEDPENSSGYHPGVSTLKYALLDPLVHFGVLKERKTGEKDLFGYKEKSEYQKSSLFDRVITFNIA